MVAESDKSPEAGAPEIEVTPAMIEAGAAAFEALSRELFFKMESLDPTEVGDWLDLSNQQRQFYRLCVAHILSDTDVVSAALSFVCSSDNPINRPVQE